MLSSDHYPSFLFIFFTLYLSFNIHCISFNDFSNYYSFSASNARCGISDFRPVLSHTQMSLHLINNKSGDSTYSTVMFVSIRCCPHLMQFVPSMWLTILLSKSYSPEWTLVFSTIDRLVRHFLTSFLPKSASSSCSQCLLSLVFVLEKFSSFVCLQNSLSSLDLKNILYIIRLTNFSGLNTSSYIFSFYQGVYLEVIPHHPIFTLFCETINFSY